MNTHFQLQRNPKVSLRYVDERLRDSVWKVVSEFMDLLGYDRTCSLARRSRPELVRVPILDPWSEKSANWIQRLRIFLEPSVHRHLIAVICESKAEAKQLELF